MHVRNPLNIIQILTFSLLQFQTESNSNSDVLFAAPLKTFTIYDKTTKSTPRSTFFQKFKNGISFQNKARKEIQELEAQKRKEEQDGVIISSFDEDESLEEQENQNWDEYSLSQEEKDKEQKRQTLEKAFDKGFNQPLPCLKPPPVNQNEYQFVGVIEPKQVKWYARPKPSNAKWSIRLVHVDKAALIRDLFVSGKVDLYASYHNNGRQKKIVTKNKEQIEQFSTVDIEPVYTVKERSWRTLWNFNPLAYLTSRSGMYWRETKLPKQGLYTDGETLYESTYRYMEGKNGMKPLQNIDLTTFLENWDTALHSEKDSKRILLEKLDNTGLKKNIAPDVVLEY